MGLEGVKGVGFDLFNTLVTVEPYALKEALGRLLRSLRREGLQLDGKQFVAAHRRAAAAHMEAARQSGVETHNRFWISAALAECGWEVDPEDRRIAAAVEAYFSAFLDFSRVVPGTRAMLASLRQRYRLGLLSNFTHAPAARGVLHRLGLAQFFPVVVISGAVGLRKPHRQIFAVFVERMELAPAELAFVGDDPEADVSGAGASGLLPIWSTYVRDHGIPSAPGLMAKAAAAAAPDIACISTWQELHVLLDGRRK